MFLGKHRPSLTWEPYQNIVQQGFIWQEAHLPLADILGRKHGVVLARIGMTGSASHPSQSHQHQVNANSTSHNSQKLPEFILSEMLQKVNFRKHPKNTQKLTYSLSTAGQRGAAGRAGTSQEEVCQIIWEEFHGAWKNHVSLRK